MLPEYHARGWYRTHSVVVVFYRRTKFGDVAEWEKLYGVQFLRKSRISVDEMSGRHFIRLKGGGRLVEHEPTQWYKCFSTHYGELAEWSKAPHC